MYNSLYFRLKT